MKKNLIIILLAGFLVVPAVVSASIFNGLLGTVKDLQKQVVDIVSSKMELVKPVAIKATTTGETWKTYTSSTLGYEVQYPRDFGTTTIFLVVPEYKDTDALVKLSREDFLKKILKPDSSVVELSVQDAAIFFRDAQSDDMYINPDKYLSKISTSTKQIGSSTVEYILHSSKTDLGKFGGGSTEKIIFTNGSTTIMMEANFSAETPSGPTKVVFDKMLTTFKFIKASSTPVLGISASSTLVTATSTTASATTTSSTNQVAGTLLAE